MYFSKSKIFLFCLISFILGIAIASWLPPRYLEKDLLWFIVCLSLCLATILFWARTNIRLVTLLSLFLFLGIWRYAISLPLAAPDKIWYYNNQDINLQAQIIAEPDVRADKQKLDVQALSINGVNHKITGEILVTANLYPNYNYGDELQLHCQLAMPEKINDFAYDRYLARYDIYSVCYYPQIKKIGIGGNKMLAAVFNLKGAIRQQIDRNLNEPQASLAAGILLGDMSGAGQDLQLAFARTGLSHITAVSGMNISILAVFTITTLLFIGLSCRQAFIFSTIFLIAFIVMVGLPASAVRAGIMGFLALLAVNIGRLNRLTNALFFSAAILLLFNPKLLRDDVGFQLSFLAVLGIIYAYPLLNSLFDKIKIPSLHGARDILNVTLSAQVFTLPIIAYNFSVVSLIAPLTNLLVLWSITCLTIGIMVVVAISFILPSLAFWLFVPIDLLLRYMINVVQWGSALPLAYYEINYLSAGWLIIYYVVVSLLIFYFSRQKN